MVAHQGAPTRSRATDACSDVTATYADGILEVRVPMAGEGDRSRKIAVTRG
jgi:HSP20 family molecular chaperone IbpA